LFRVVEGYPLAVRYLIVAFFGQQDYREPGEVAKGWYGQLAEISNPRSQISKA
jgi:hypothetical protein